MGKNDIVNVIYNIRMSLMAVILVLGLFGNTMAIVIMQQKKYKKISTCLYMTAISVVDNMQIILYLIFWVYQEIKNDQIDKAYCMLRVFSIGWTLEASTYLIIAMTIDRSLMLKMPHTKKWRAPKRVKIIICLVIVLTSFRNAHRFKFATTIFDENLKHLTCSLYREDYPGSQEFAIIDALVQTIIPACILLSFNSYIIHKMKKKVQIGVALSANIPNQQPNENLFKAKQRGITVMLICVSFGIVAFTLPVFLMIMIAKRIDKDYQNIIIFGFYQLSLTIYFMSFSANFYICLIGGSRFRKDVRRYLGKCFPRRCTLTNVVAPVH
ncbi:unnamed protein product [Owenia fusiformis]|uniref:Uncharacterized protein n=1 Tax=Owenia fusiformis TaxID=6347 RepID=A0A8J1UBW5_OWEFU|nr:unnamed protein product [Owenia fusiformis]